VKSIFYSINVYTFYSLCIITLPLHGKEGAALVGVAQIYLTRGAILCREQLLEVRAGTSHVEGGGGAQNVGF
jgi:hypothetical protein